MSKHTPAPLEYNAAGLKTGLVVARFNQAITELLYDGARETWRHCGGVEVDLQVARVPGAFELPLAARNMALTGRFDAVVCLGCVIRGETTHYDYVCEQAAAGIMQVGLATGIPIIFGVVTTENMEQALARAGGAAGNKGADAVLAAIEMVGVLREIGS